MNITRFYAQMITATCTILMSSGVSANDQKFTLPIACEPGVSCFIQQYTDLDPGPGAADYTCGTATYDGHNGTDFRLPTLRDAAGGVAVLAVAPGVLRVTRDGMADKLVRTENDRVNIKGRECGNGVTIDHGEGLQTQYCHLRRGSIRVFQGQLVKRGEELGQVGYSGDAAFAHVHLTVRRNGQVIDPFRDAGDGADCTGAIVPLWREDVLTSLSYHPAQILGGGFAAGAVELKKLETGQQGNVSPARSSKAVVAWGWAINIQKNDKVVVQLDGPEGEIAHNETVLRRNKSQYMLFAGRRKPVSGWPVGTYVSQFTVWRKSKRILTSSYRAVIQ
jgi:hypothetical protein